MIVELHVIQNIAPANLNRDDTGAPKDAIFGGYRRARVSSQAWKRAVRDAFLAEGLIPEEQIAVRSRRMLIELRDRLVTAGKDEQAATAIVEALFQGLEIARDTKSPAEDPLTQYLLYLGREEIDRLAALADQHWDILAQAIGGVREDSDSGKRTARQAKRAAGQKIPEAVKRATEAVLDGGKAADLALFGRMLADLPGKNIDGSAQVAHAISTHAVDFEFDFYTAVDDLNPREETGAGMMGTVEFNSATFYRYANIDIAQLAENLNRDEELARGAVRAFARAFLTSIPTGKQNSFAAHNLPSFAFAVVRDRGRWSLANAFADPIRKGRGDLVGESIRALGDQWRDLVAMYGGEEISTKSVLVQRKYSDLLGDGLSAPAPGMPAWLDSINDALKPKQA